MAQGGREDQQLPFVFYGARSPSSQRLCCAQHEGEKEAADVPRRGAQMTGQA